MSVVTGMVERDTKGITAAVIGGGPSGASAAIRLIHNCRKADIDCRVYLFEGKDFEVHYNQCAGVLSPPIEEVLLDELKIKLPYSLFKRQIRGYRLHAGGNEVLLVGEHRYGPTYAVRRVNFDNYMLESAAGAGADVVRSRVTGLEFYRTGHEKRAMVYSEGGTVVVDYVIGAFGLDDGMLDIFERATESYKRPDKYMKTYVTKLSTERKFIEKRLGDIIYAFLYPPSSRKIEFGAITPKGDHIIVNIAGNGVVVDDFINFLEMDEVKQHLPSVSIDLSQVFMGKFPSSPARGVTGPAYLVTGDATGFLRPFKGKGITTATMTGIYAADAVVKNYLVGESLTSYEVKCKELMKDYFYGSVVRIMGRFAETFGTLGYLLETSKTEKSLYEGLFNSVSGHDSFRNILSNNIHLKSLISVAKMKVKEV